MWVRSQEEEENSRRRREQERNDQAEAVRIVTFRDWIQAGDSGDVVEEASINTDRDDQTLSPPTYEEYLEEGSKKDPPAYDVAVGDDRV